MEFREKIDNFKSTLNLFEICTRLGYEPQRGKICCPWHEEKTPSLQIYEKSVYCFGCQKRSDAIELVMKVTGLIFKDAMNWLSNLSHQSSPDFTKDASQNYSGQEFLSFKECLANEKYVARLEVLRFITDYLNKFTQEKIAKRKVPAHIHAWLMKRGFNVQHILLNHSKDILLFVDDAPYLTSRVKYKCKNWALSGMFDKQGNLKWFGRDYAVAFPIYNEWGVTSMRLRNVTGGSPKDVEVNMIEQERIHSLPSSFGFMGAKKIEDFGKGRRILLTEGAPDMLAGYHLFDGLSLSTGNVKKADLVHNLELIRHCDELILCFDNDAVGEETSRNVSQVAYVMGIKNIRRFKLGEHKDLNEFLIAYEKKEVVANNATAQLSSNP